MSANVMKMASAAAAMAARMPRGEIVSMAWRRMANHQRKHGMAGNGSARFSGAIASRCK